MQNELLAKYPKADVRVYAVWFNMMAGDARETWPVELLTDRRVVHRWDDPKAVGTFLGENKPRMEARLTPDSSGTGGSVLWDSYLLYGPDARWDAFPTGLIHWGRTIVAARQTLLKEFEVRFGSGKVAKRLTTIVPYWLGRMDDHRSHGRAFGHDGQIAPATQDRKGRVSRKFWIGQ